MHTGINVEILGYLSCRYGFKWKTYILCACVYLFFYLLKLPVWFYMDAEYVLPLPVSQILHECILTFHFILMKVIYLLV